MLPEIGNLRREWMKSPGGLLIPNDGGTVAHPYFNAVGIVDPFGNAWTQNGTVPQVARSGRTPAGAGPFSDTNYYSLGTGNDVLDFAGDFSLCFIVNPVNFGASGFLLFTNGATGVSGSGYYCNVDSTGHAILTTATAGSVSATQTTANALITGAVNVICVGRAGTTGYIKANLGTLVTGATAAITPGTTITALLGKFTSAGFALNGSLYEKWASTTTPTDALFTAIMQRVHARLGISAW